MRKAIIAMLLVLTAALGGCADVSTAPAGSENYGLLTEI